MENKKIISIFDCKKIFSTAKDCCFSMNNSAQVARFQDPAFLLSHLE